LQLACWDKPNQKAPVSPISSKIGVAKSMSDEKQSVLKKLKDAFAVYQGLK